MRTRGQQRERERGQTLHEKTKRRGKTEGHLETSRGERLKTQSRRTNIPEIEHFGERDTRSSCK